MKNLRLKRIPLLHKQNLPRPPVLATIKKRWKFNVRNVTAGFVSHLIILAQLAAQTAQINFQSKEMLSQKWRKNALNQRQQSPFRNLPSHRPLRMERSKFHVQIALKHFGSRVHMKVQYVVPPVPKFSKQRTVSNNHRRHEYGRSFSRV